MKRLLYFALCLASIRAAAQDPQFSQYYQAPLYLNPGFTGITQHQRVAFNHRVQWPGVANAFSTYAASYDIFVPDMRSGFGFLFTTDKMGSAGWRTTTANFLYSYKVKLTEKLVFSPGLSFGYGSNGLERSKLSLGDGLQYGGESLDPELHKLGMQNFFDFSSGLLIYSKDLWLGASFMHMNRPNLSVLGETSRLPVKTSVHGGARFSMNSRHPTQKTPYLTPSFVYRVQGSFSQLDLGINYHIDPVSVGMWYRGKPFRKSITNTVEQDALIFFTGLYIKKLTIGYSYDFTLSSLETASGGSHEVSIIYEFATRSNRKTSNKKYKLIPCPSFYNTRDFPN